MRLSSLSTLLSLSLFVSSCVPTSQNPLCDPKTAQRDDAIVGLWRGGDPESKKAILLYFQPGEGGRAELVTIEDGSKESGPGVLVGHALTSKAGALTCMSVALTGQLKSGRWDPKDKPDYFIFRYDVKDGTLSLAMLAESAVAAAIEAGTLEGTKEGPRITDSGENIAKFIAAGDAAKLFEPKTMLFRRVTLPDAPQAPK